MSDEAAPALELPLDRPRGAGAAAPHARVSFRLEPSLTSRLAALCQSRGAKLWDGLLAAFAVLLHRYSAQEDFSVARAEGEAVTTLRIDVSRAPTLGAFIERTRTAPAERGAARAQALFATGTGLDPKWVSGGLPELALVVEGEQGSVFYRPDLFEEATARRLPGHLATLLEDAMGHPDTPVDRLALLTDAEERLLLRDRNATATDFPQRTLAELIEEQVASRPEATAVSFRDQTLSYRELNLRANEMAAALIDLGVGPERLVALRDERGPELLTAMLAVTKAGGAFLPLDPHSPPERIQKVLEQGRPALMLCGEKFLPQLEQLVATLPSDAQPRLRAIGALRQGGATSNPPTRAHGRSLAYVMFTSGSTGVPKGAMVEQRGMVNHMFAKNRDLGVGPGDVVAQTATQNFDIFVFQNLAPLVSGAQVRIVGDDAAVDPQKLRAEVKRGGITVLNIVPTVLRAIVDDLASDGAARADYQSLRWMVPTGEALPPELCREWFQLFPDKPLLNAYGHTECSDDQAHCVLREAPARPLTPVGKPIQNLRFYVLDAHGQPVAPGVVGELYIGGVGVGRGYLADPAKTAEKFVPDAFSGEQGARLYRTGDVGRWLPDGQLECAGRVDFMVKLHGFRIELGEIEAALARLPEVRDAVVNLARALPSNEKLLAAYVVPREGKTLTEDGLRAALKRALPQYMIPTAFVVLKALPLSPNGKVDRKALPPPRVEQPQEQSAFEPPEGDVEKRIAQLWTKIRRLEKVGRHDDFFESGGNSLTLMQLATRVSDYFEIELPAGLLFDAPSVAGVAALVEAALVKQGKRTVAQKALSAFKVAPSEGARALREVPASFTEVRHFRWWEQADDHVAGRLVSATVWLEGRPDVDALKRAVVALMTRHDLLRSLYANKGDDVVRLVQSDPSPPLRLLDFSKEPDPEKAALAELDEELLRRFDLLRELPFRVGLFALSAERHLLYIRADHIVADNEGARLLVSELKGLYNALARGERVDEAGPPMQYADFALWQRRLCADAQFRDGELTYWRARLEGARPITQLLPTDFPRAPVEAARAERYLVAFPVGQIIAHAPAQTAAKMKALTGHQSATLSAATLAGFAVVLARRAQVDQLFVSTLNDYRRRVSGLDGVLGSFNNSTLLHMNVGGAPTSSELIRRAQGELNASFARPEFPLIPLLFPRLNDFFRVALTFVPDTEEPEVVPWHGLTARPLSRQAAVGHKFKTIWDVMMVIFEEQGSFRIVMSYNATLFNADTARALVDSYVDVLSRLASGPDAVV